MSATFCINPNYNSINIFFDSIPDVKIRSKMKNHGFKWHKMERYWFARQNADRLKFVKKLCGSPEPEPEKAKEPEAKTEEQEPEKAKTNKYGVQVGDIFYCSWGYDQTNVDFFQVVKLCGESSVRVREVQPKVKSEKAESGMSSVKTYKITREILPPVASVFINDNENGDLKRLKSYHEDGISNPVFSIGSGGHLCHLEPQGETTHFESWWR